ncbi:TIGR03905 family TSCPD domain-containing protein [Anaeromicropila populeti]|uniref:ribonucleoside-diphosphate reductase n=1 Tax=Anaeromicropila populeti TaxID=37658 RepID=A0A1I6LS71_9FIRM|nr:TIGR03905 family TSCPD domain-containing protein [Anaeromicropila populeti]SFS06345.1 uncharacterized protein TIGR03905 [Anaeromicropila populeti]
MVFKTKGVCASQINIEIEDDIIKSVEFVGGCSGNSQGIARLTIGMHVNEVIDRLEGVTCGYKATSCPDQLAKALKKYQAEH